MSIFKKVGKFIGGNIKSSINFAGNAVGVGQVFSDPYGLQKKQATPGDAAPVAQSIFSQVENPERNVLTDIMRLPGAIVDTLTGKTRIQTDVNVGSQMPTWALPAALGLGAILLFSGGRRR